LRIIGYERVSTARQGASGLGIEAQRQAIDGFVAHRNGTLTARFTEVESGRKPDRPELCKALHLAKVTGATLVIAKLDRLSRNAAFLLTLRDSGVRLVAVELPEANDLTVGIMALVAQQEREGAGGRQGARREARQSERGCRASSDRQGWRAPSDRHCEERPSARPGPGAGDRRYPLGRGDEPPGHSGGAEWARHANPARRTLARVNGDELAGSTGAADVRQSRLMSLVEAAAQCPCRLLIAVATQLVAFPILGLQASVAKTSSSRLRFTGVSIVRSYALGRLFEALRSIWGPRGASGPEGSGRTDPRLSLLRIDQREHLGFLTLGDQCIRCSTIEERMRAEKPMHRVLWRHSGEQRHEHVRFVRTRHIHPHPRRRDQPQSQVA
jgi:hypothetical protein